MIIGARINNKSYFKQGCIQSNTATYNTTKSCSEIHACCHVVVVYIKLWFSITWNFTKQCQTYLKAPYYATKIPSPTIDFYPQTSNIIVDRGKTTVLLLQPQRHTLPGGLVQCLQHKTMAVGALAQYPIFAPS